MNVIDTLRRWRRPADRHFLSIVVVVFNMAREARRTLQSLSPAYQQGVGEDDYEVVVVDNGSDGRLPASCFEGLGANVTYHYIEKASPSPAAAVNYGVARSRGSVVGIMVDGARILTPGVVHHARCAAHAHPRPVIVTLGWHLGPDLQTRSILAGYTREVEDGLLAGIGWPNDGYRLFEISSLAGSCSMGWFMPIWESNCLFVLREAFETLGGYDERFDSPGGGLVNLDFYKRACELPGAALVTILGEGNFHQLHGGVATNTPEEASRRLWREWEERYAAIRGRNFMPPTVPSQYVGRVAPPALPWLARSVEIAVRSRG